ncbi:hypothetical protein [Litoreibacter janthinus]|nr:hypothetical protein [Litoreibacter janthinus]
MAEVLDNSMDEAVSGIYIAVGSTVSAAMETASTDIKRCVKIQSKM